MSGASIGEFVFGDGRHFHVRIATAHAAVRVDRQYPDPDKGRAVATATGLDSPDPTFTFPLNWTPPQREAARAAILAAWRRHNPDWIGGADVRQAA